MSAKAVESTYPPIRGFGTVLAKRTMEREDSNFAAMKMVGPVLKTSGFIS
jgi:hypothetical protein